MYSSKMISEYRGSYRAFRWAPARAPGRLRARPRRADVRVCPLVCAGLRFVGRGRDGCEGLRDGCEVRLCDSCVRASRVSRVCPGLHPVSFVQPIPVSGPASLFFIADLLFLRLLSRPRFRLSRGSAGVSYLGLDGCEVRLCPPCVRVCACVSRVCPGSPRCL